MKRSTRLLSMLCLSLSLVAGTSSVFAQESGEPSSAEELSITQGRAAVLLANSLGFYVGQDGPLTPVRAVELLMQNGITPMGGWKINEMLTVNQLAVVLGQSLGLDADFTEEQKADESAQAYKEALVSEYNLDLEQIIAGAIRVTSGSNVNDGSPGFEQPFPFDPDQLVSESDINQVIAAFAPTTGGSGGQVDSGSSNMTPSAP